MSEAVREMTYEEEFTYYEKRVKEVFDNYKNPNGNEDPLEICVIRDGLRALRKAIDLINRLKADVERLETGQLKEAMTFNSNTIKNATNEALKEFVERLKNKVTYYEDACGNFVPFVDCRDIDNLLKEMVGE